MRQRSLMPHALLPSCVALPVIASFLLSVASQPLEWSTTHKHIIFAKQLAQHLSPPYQLYNPQDFSKATKIYTPADAEHFGVYVSHAWAPDEFVYTLDLTLDGFPRVDLKLGFAEQYAPLCRWKGREFSVDINGQDSGILNIFRLVGCRKPHDVVFLNVDATRPIPIAFSGTTENPMIANIAVRKSMTPPTSSPSTLVSMSPVASTSSGHTDASASPNPLASASPTPPGSRTSAPLPSSSPSSENETPTASPSSPLPENETPTASPSSPSPENETPTASPSSSPHVTLPSPRLEPPDTGATSQILTLEDEAFFLKTGSNTAAIPGTQVLHDDTIFVSGTIRPPFFSSFRNGSRFSYNFESSGTYEIQLGFAEIDSRYCEGGLSRRFSVSLNGKPIAELQNLNVFEAVGCRHAFIWTSPPYYFAPRLYITFHSVQSSAMISYIMLRKVETSCVPESTANGATADHISHSVPGEYPVVRTESSPRSYSDSDNNGYETVWINGWASHSHFFDVKNKVIGRVVAYEWTSPDTGEFISDKQKFFFQFFLGTTRVFLTVRDNVCSSDGSETSVTVTGSIAGGSWCYFYSGTRSVVDGEGLDLERKPDFAQWYPKTEWNFAGLPISAQFSTRCFFFAQVAEDIKELSGTIEAVGGKLTVSRGMDVEVKDKNSGAFSIALVASLTAFEVSFLRTSTDVVASANFKINPALNAKISHDKSTIFPVATDMKPSSSSISGVSTASVRIIGPLKKPAHVNVGDHQAPVKRIDWSAKRVYFAVPPTDVEGPVFVSVAWDGEILSNNLLFNYKAEQKVDSVGFQEVFLTESTTGKKAENEFATSVRIGYDGRLYLGTLTATVVRLTYDMETLKVTHRCRSKPIVDQQFKKDGVPARRDILGLVIDPRHKRHTHIYVTSQTLYHYAKDRVDRDNFKAWRSGAIDRLRPGADANDASICLVYNKRIVSNLPVSNHDHGLNALEFTQDGDLIVQSGGFTNTGLPGKGLGQLWEPPLAAAILKFPLSKASFNGDVRYTNDTHPEMGSVSSGDVDVLATGLRNPFSMALHSSGRLYSSDNGPNIGYGNVAVECGEKDKDIEYPRADLGDWPGTMVMRDGWKRFSIGRPDKLLWIKTDGKARYYGHPHLHRGECAWIDPVTNRDALGRNAPENYDAPLALFTSSTNAIVEYHAGNVFGGKLRGQLILSTFKDRPTYMIPPITKPGEAKYEVLSQRGGLSAVVNARGDIILPQISSNKILILRPKVPKLEAQTGHSVTGVTPLRHPGRGGSVATIAGYNFGTSGAKIQIWRLEPVTFHTAVAPWTKTAARCGKFSIEVPLHESTSRSSTFFADEGRTRTTPSTADVPAARVLLLSYVGPWSNQAALLLQCLLIGLAESWFVLRTRAAQTMAPILLFRTVRTVVATAASFVGAKLWTRLLSFLVEKKRLRPYTARKIMHVTTAPLFSLTWPLYPRDPYSSLLAAFVPLSFALRIFWDPSSDKIIRAVARTSDATFHSVESASASSSAPPARTRQLASGPAAYGLAVSLLTALSWRARPETYVSLAALCFGDGMADVIGSNFRSPRLPLPSAIFTKNKTVLGTVACFISTVVAAWFWLRIPLGQSLLATRSVSARQLAISAAAAAAVETLPFEDNLLVPLVTYIIISKLQVK